MLPEDNFLSLIFRLNYLNPISNLIASIPNLSFWGDQIHANGFQLNNTNEISSILRWRSIIFKKCIKKLRLIWSRCSFTIWFILLMDSAIIFMVPIFHFSLNFLVNLNLISSPYSWQKELDIFLVLYWKLLFYLGFKISI